MAAKAPMGRRRTATMAPEASARTALVVEDDEHIGHLLQFMLARAGYEVVLARDGRAGLAHIRANPAPAVALFDVMLPFADGLQLVGAARATPGWEKVPVVMLTSKSHERDIVRALDAGANDYVVKPFQPEELLARLRRLVGPRA